jgi:glycosyltransferase involved in cell wall biosynthesis
LSGENIHLRICAVIPAYDEAARIASVIEATRAYLPTVFVVDDGSTDATREKALASGALVLGHARNRGKGAALRTGFREALARGYDAVVTLDGDGQHDPNEIPELLLRAGSSGAPIVVGARIRRRSAMPLHRRANNAIVSAVGTWLCGQRVPDVQSGFRFLRRDVLSAVQTETIGYEMEAELLVRAGRMGFPIESAPVTAIYADERSHVEPWREIVRYTRLLFRCLSAPPPRSVRGQQTRSMPPGRADGASPAGEDTAA